MSIVQGIISDLRAKRLLPVAVALLVALIAVPLLLSSKAKSVPVGPATPPYSPVTNTGIPALSVQAPPTLAHLTDPPRDPFHQQVSSTTSTSASSGSSSSSAATSSSSVASQLSKLGSASAPTGSSGGSSGGSTSGSTPTPPQLAPTPPSSLPGPSSTAPAGLSDTDSYHVTLALTNSGGGLDTIDPLERLSILPSKEQPLLVELGVLKGGDRVLFAVQPGTVVKGPGTCTPGPIDCEILSLGRESVEQLSIQAGGDVVPVALFAVTGISAEQHSSVAAANKARNAASAAGRALLHDSTLTALSLFKYEPSLGAVVDLRNLTIGGS